MNLIVARGKNGEIGKDNSLLWSLPTDMKFFKEMTKGKIVVMGRKTWESLGEKPLPDRINVVLSRNYKYKYDEVLKVAKTNIEEFIHLPLVMPNSTFIIGGAEIYKEFASHVRTMYITEVEKEFPEADTFFTFPEGDWAKITLYRGMENGISFEINKWEKVHYNEEGKEENSGEIY